MNAPWDLWVDYHRIDAEGLTHASIDDAEDRARLTPGAVIVVGNEEASPVAAEVVSVDERGVVLVRVFPGAVEDHRSLLGERAPTT